MTKNRLPEPHRGKFAEVLDIEGDKLRQDVYLKLESIRDGLFSLDNVDYRISKVGTVHDGELLQAVL